MVTQDQLHILLTGAQQIWMLKMQGQLQHTQLILNLVMTQEVASINMLTSLLVLTHLTLKFTQIFLV